MVTGSPVQAGRRHTVGVNLIENFEVDRLGDVPRLDRFENFRRLTWIRAM